MKSKRKRLLPERENKIRAQKGKEKKKSENKKKQYRKKMRWEKDSGETH